MNTEMAQQSGDVADLEHVEQAHACRASGLRITAACAAFGGSRTQSQHGDRAQQAGDAGDVERRAPAEIVGHGTSTRGATLCPSSAAKKFCMMPALTPRRCSEDSTAMMARHTGRNGPFDRAHDEARGHQHGEMTSRALRGTSTRRR